MIMLYGSFDSHYKPFPVNSAAGVNPSYTFYKLKHHPTKRAEKDSVQ